MSQEQLKKTSSSLLSWDRIKDRHRWPRSWWHSPPVGTVVTKREARKKLQELKPLHDQTSETIRRSMLTLLVLAFFCLLTAFGTEDVQLLRAESSIQLPSFANAPISFLGFLVAAPFLLIVVITYLHVFVAYGRGLEGKEVGRNGRRKREDHYQAVTS